MTADFVDMSILQNFAEQTDLVLSQILKPKNEEKVEPK